jgi:hypothetical protein
MALPAERTVLCDMQRDQCRGVACERIYAFLACVCRSADRVSGRRRSLGAALAWTSALGCGASASGRPRLSHRPRGQWVPRTGHRSSMARFHLQRALLCHTLHCSWRNASLVRLRAIAIKGELVGTLVGCCACRQWRRSCSCPSLSSGAPLAETGNVVVNALASFVHQIDESHNSMPSLHAGLSTMILLTHGAAQKSFSLAVHVAVWAFVISSALLTKQHLLMDVIAGSVGSRRSYDRKTSTKETA